MEIVFEKEYLSQLYYKGDSGDKKHRFQPQIVKKYINTVNLTYPSEKETRIVICSIIELSNHYK